MTGVRGKEICRHVALGYRFVLQSMMERTAQEAERRANDESLGKTLRKQYEKLTAWIRSMTLKQLLDWFDCVERVEVRNLQVVKRSPKPRNEVDTSLKEALQNPHL